jgi:tRNA(Ile)-lysidine synthase
VQAAEAIDLRPCKADFSLVGEQDVVAVAVSGGSDSVGLLHFTLNALGPRRTVALTVDHGLRAASADEARIVAGWCRALGVRHHILHWQGEKPAQGVQARARQMRYDLLSAWCRDNGIGILLTGHTANDQAETVVMRAQRTNSVRSAAGIWPETNWQGVRVVRPILSLTREDVQDWLVARKINWLDDPSNVNPAFERVRVRQDLRAGDVPGLVQRAAEAQHMVRVMDGAAMGWLRAHAEISGFGYITLPRPAFEHLSDDVADAALRWCLLATGAGHAPAPDRISGLRHNLAGAVHVRQTLGGALVARRSGTIIIGREPGRVVERATIPETGQVVWDGRFVVSGPAGAPIRAAQGLRPDAKTTLPAFVVAGLPVVQSREGVWDFPHFSASNTLAVRLDDRFRL